MGKGRIPKLDLKKIVGENLPAMPETAIRLLELSQDPDCGPSEFAVPVEADPGLGAADKQLPGIQYVVGTTV